MTARPPLEHDALGLLLEIRDELRALRAAVERREGGNLLSVIHAAAQGREFTAAELVRHAAVHADLRQALACEFGDTSSRRLGKWLAAVAGRPLGGFIAETIGADREGRIWTVRAVQVCPGKLAPVVAIAAPGGHPVETDSPEP